MTAQNPSFTGRLLAYWWNKGNNFGDVMNPLLLGQLTGYDIEWSNRSDYPVFAAAGSIIDTFHTRPGWCIWGSGVIAPDAGIPEQQDIRAVRGPKTREHLLRHGYSEIPRVYGDPGLLLPVAFPNTDTVPAYDLGIIPHYAFRLNPSMHLYRLTEACLQLIGRGLKVRIISPKLPPADFIAQINACKSIAANSLHGLITGLAYGKPCQWIHFDADPFAGRVTSEFVGDTFKYEDFLQSINCPTTAPILIRRPGDFEQVLEGLQQPLQGSFDPEPLLEAFPYKPAGWGNTIQKAQEHFKRIGYL